MTSAEKVGYHKLTETVCKYKWTLYNFSSFNEPTGTSIESEIFLSNGIKWLIELYPNGFEDDSKEYISIYLVCLNNVRITVHCELIISNSVKVYEVQKFDHTFVFDKTHLCPGFPFFVKRDNILADLKETNDILTIVLKMSFSNSSQDTNYLNLLKHVGSLLDTRENTDVILVSSDESEYKVHKAILSCRSKVFSAMFQHNMKESQDNVVKIKDVDNETLKAMLNFVYTGELVLDIKDISKKLLIAADKYEFDDLKKICVNYLLHHINFDNVLDLIKLADTYNISKLKLKAKEYFIQNRKEVLSIERRQNLNDLSRDIIQDLLCDLASA